MLTLFVRTVLIYILVSMALRIMGKRQLAELQPSEFVVTILISNLATVSIEESNVPLLSSLIPMFTLVSFEVIMSIIILKSSFFQHLATGNPRILIKDGILDQKEMKNLRWTIEDLMEQLRQLGIFDIDEVSFAIVETSGSLSAYQKFDNRNLTNKIFASPGKKEDDSPSMLLISDGKIQKEAVSFCGTDNAWIEKILKAEGVPLKGVFMMTCDKSLAYKIIKKEC